MKLASQVIKKVEGENRAQGYEDTFPLKPKRKKTSLKLLLFLGLFFILAGSGYFLYSTKFKNPTSSAVRPKVNLSERLKKTKSKPLTQDSVSVKVTRVDSTLIQASTPKDSVSVQKIQTAEKSEPLLAEKKALPEKEKSSASKTLKSETATLKVNKKLPLEKSSQPDRLILSTPLTKAKSKSTDPVSAKENSQLVKNYFEFGVESQRKGRLQEAEECYLKSLSLDSSFYPARLNLSTIYLQEDKLIKAEKELSWLLDKNPEEPKVLYNFALLYHRKNEFEKAKELLERLLLSNPDNSKAHLLEGKNFEAQNRLDAAIKAYSLAYQLDPHDPLILYSLGRAKDLAGEKKEALTYYHLFLKKNSEKDSDLMRSVEERVNFLNSGGEGND